MEWLVGWLLMANGKAVDFVGHCRLGRRKRKWGDDKEKTGQLNDECGHEKTKRLL